MVEDAASRGRTKCQWSTRRKLSVIVAALVVAFIVSIPLAYLFESAWGFQPYVSYSYTLGIASNTSDQFRVLCPFPADGEGRLCSFALTNLHVIGNATTTINVTTEYGEALEVIGNGLVLVTWASESKLPGPWTGYKDYRSLSLLGGAGYGSDARIYSEGGNILFDLRFDYEYVYGSVGADFIKYEIVGGLESNWNTLPVDYMHAVA